MAIAGAKRRVEHRYEPKGGALELLWARQPEILLDGPAGTGKSRAWGEYIYWIATTFPGARILVARKTRVSLSESWLVTWEEKVLPPGSPLLRGATRSHRESYVFPNRSVVVPAGLDSPRKLFSSEWDLIYVNEATELKEDEWESFHRGLRNHKVPWQQLGGDCNPDIPTHWLNQRCIANPSRPALCRRIVSAHEDNPSITPDYLARLRSLTGVRYKRLYLGEWCAAEGQVWENYDRDIHLLTPPRLEDGRVDYAALGIQWFFASFDWGFTAPGCLQVWGACEDGTLYRVCEIYRRNELLETWARWVRELHDEFRFLAVVCDPSRNDAIVAFNRLLCPASPTGTSLGAIARGAENSKTTVKNAELSGLDIVRSWLEPGPLKKPHLYLLRDVNRHVDRALMEASQPWRTEDELPGYVYWRNAAGVLTEQTDPAVPDHGCDALRYAVWFAWERFPLAKRVTEKYKPGTLGAILGHQKVWEQTRKRAG